MHFVRGTDVNIRVARLSVHFSSLWLRFSSAIFPAAASHLGSEGTEQPRVPACWTVTLPLPHSNLLTTMFPCFLRSFPMPGPKEEKNHSDKTQTGALESFQNSTAVTIITLSSSLMFKCFLEWASLKSERTEQALQYESALGFVNPNEEAFARQIWTSITVDVKASLLQVYLHAHHHMTGLRWAIMHIWLQHFTKVTQQVSCFHLQFPTHHSVHR